MVSFSSKYSSSLIALSALLLLSGCASYKSSVMSTIVPTAANSEKKIVADKEEITVAAQAFDCDDCFRYLDRDVLKHGYQPVQLTVYNNSQHHLELSLSRITLPIVPSWNIAPLVHTNTAGRVVGYLVGGLFIPFLWIAAIVDGIGSAEANEKLDRDFSEKSLRDLVIKPMSSANGLIFVPSRDYRLDFEVPLFDQTTKTLLTFRPFGGNNH